MISRRTTKLLADVIALTFQKHQREGLSGSGEVYSLTDTQKVYDFLYENDYDAWFCNLGRAASNIRGTRALEEFIMKLHTGESLVQATTTWDWESRQKLGQRLLQELAEDIWAYWEHKLNKPYASGPISNLLNFQRSIELDGYEFKNGHLLMSEAEVLDLAEETGILQTLYSSLLLAKDKTAFHHLKLSEEHYIAQKWDDSISNSRKFLECVLQEVAARHASTRAEPLPESTYTSPFKIRDYLEREGLLEKKEKEALAAVYGLLSHTGGHPYMAENDQARLLRHWALTFSQFVMLRLKGNYSTNNSQYISFLPTEVRDDFKATKDTVT